MRATIPKKLLDMAAATAVVSLHFNISVGACRRLQQQKIKEDLGNPSGIQPQDRGLRNSFGGQPSRSQSLPGILPWPEPQLQGAVRLLGVDHNLGGTIAGRLGFGFRTDVAGRLVLLLVSKSEVSVVVGGDVVSGIGSARSEAESAPTRPR